VGPQPRTGMLDGGAAEHDVAALAALVAPLDPEPSDRTSNADIW